MADTIDARLPLSLLQAVRQLDTPDEIISYAGSRRRVIALIEDRLDVVELVSRRDYRRERLAAGPLWLTPPDRAAMDAAARRARGSVMGMLRRN